MIESFEHHAYCFGGSREDIISKLVEDIERSGTAIRGNPDFRQAQYDVLGIDDARALTEAAERTAFSGGKKIFIVAARGITKEAQNAFLKILEEPPKETHFFFVLPTLQVLLPTFRSRLCEVRHFTEMAVVQESLLLVESFLQGTVPVRLKAVQKLLKEVEEQDAGKGRIFDFLDVLERAVAEDTKSNAKVLSEILEVKKYSRDRAPSVKLLLEHLALLLPKV